MVILIWGPLSRVNLGRFLAFSLIRCSDAIVTIVHCERPSWEGEVWVRKLMEIIGVPWMIVLIMPPTIIVFLIGFTFFDEIEATSRYSYLKWAIRFLCSVGVGNNLWGLVSWFVRSGLLSITNLQAFAIGWASGLLCLRRYSGGREEKKESLYGMNYQYD